MRLPFGKKQVTKAVEFSEVGQGVPVVPPSPEPDKLDRIINDLRVISENQVVTYEAIRQLGALVVQLSQEAPVEPPMTTTKIKKAK